MPNSQDNKVLFMLAAVGDIQATIRAIDVKAGALLTALLLPLASLGKIWNHLTAISASFHDFVGIIFGSLFFLLWLCVLFILVKIISPLDNPSCHVTNTNSCTGVFYSGHLYGGIFSFADYFFNGRIICASKSTSEFLEELPVSDDLLIKELAFEQMKLVYIRDIKLFRLNMALTLAGLWLLVSVVVYLFSKIFI